MSRCSRIESFPDLNNDREETDNLPSKHGEHLDTEALSESVGSVEVEAVDPKPVISLSNRRHAIRKGSGSTGSQFMQFCVEMRDVSVQDAWAFFRDQKAISTLARGILENLFYIEGDGGAGTVFVTSYTPECTAAGDAKYAMHKIELRDDVSHLSVLRCIGGKYSKRYKLFLSFVKVVPDEAFGDSSSLLIWRLEYVLRNSNCLSPEDSKASHRAVTEMFRDVYISGAQVKRPIDSIDDRSMAVNVRKPWRLRGDQRLIGTGKRETRASSHRRKNSTVQSLVLVELDEESEGDDETARNSKRQPYSTRKEPRGKAVDRL